jgi:hypothetical protein
MHDLLSLWKTETGWFRLHFTLDSTLRKESLALLVEQIGASEIYLNGHLIASYGRLHNGQAGVQQCRLPLGKLSLCSRWGAGWSGYGVRLLI